MPRLTVRCWSDVAFLRVYQITSNLSLPLVPLKLFLNLLFTFALHIPTNLKVKKIACLKMVLPQSTTTGIQYVVTPSAQNIIDLYFTSVLVCATIFLVSPLCLKTQCGKCLPLSEKIKQSQDPKNVPFPQCGCLKLNHSISGFIMIMMIIFQL